MNRMFWTGAALLAVGCASYPAPTEQVASSMAATRAAEEAGALLVPDASLHLKMANEELAQAKQLMRRGDNRRAEGLATRAREDAELAVAVAHEQNTKGRLEALAQASTAGGEQTEPSPGTGQGMSPESSPPAAPTTP